MAKESRYTNDRQKRAGNNIRCGRGEPAITVAAAEESQQ